MIIYRKINIFDEVFFGTFFFFFCFFLLIFDYEKRWFVFDCKLQILWKILERKCVETEQEKQKLKKSEKKN